MTKVLDKVTELTISTRTKSILANFSGINPSLMFKPGNQLRTISKNEDVLATATVEEEFPRQFAIHDLSKFLSILSLFKEPIIKFNEHFCTITSINKHYNYRYAATNTILQAPDDDVNLGDAIETFELMAKDLAELIKIISITKHPEISIVAKDGLLSILASDSKNINGDVYINQGIIGTDKTFKYVFKIEKILVLMPATYEVTVLDGIAVFESPDIKYFIAAESET